MKYFLFLVLFFNSFLSADAKKDIYHLYQDKHYDKACKEGLNVFQKYKRDEEFISLYAFSCLYADHIDRLAVPISMLKYSEEARSNSAYFAVILMQKKLLYHALVDNYKIDELKLPATDHVLSIVYDLYSKVDASRKRDYYTFEDKSNNKITYKLYLKEDNRLKKMVIEEYYDTIMTHRHIYW